MQESTDPTETQVSTEQEGPSCNICQKTEADLDPGERLLKGLDGKWYCKICYRKTLMSTQAKQKPTDLVSTATPVSEKKVAPPTVDASTASNEDENSDEDQVQIERPDPRDVVALNKEISKITGQDKDEAINSLLQTVKSKRSGEGLKELLETKMESVWSQKGRDIISSELQRVPYLTFLNYFILDLIEASIQPEHIVLSVLNLDVKRKEDKLFMRDPMISDLLDSLPWTFFLDNTKNIAMILDVVCGRLEEFRLNLTDKENWIDPEAYHIIHTIEGFYTDFQHRSNKIYDKLEIVSDSPEEINKLLTGAAAYLPRLSAIENKQKGTNTISYAEAFGNLPDAEKRDVMIQNFLDFDPEWLVYLKDQDVFLKKLFLELLKVPSSKMSPLDVMQVIERWDDTQRQKFILLFLQTLAHAEKLLIEKTLEGKE